VVLEVARGTAKGTAKDVEEGTPKEMAIAI